MGSISGSERSAVDGIVVEARPLLKCSLGKFVRLFGIPNQHFRSVVDTNFFAIGLNDTSWVVKQIIRVNDGDADFSIRQFTMFASKSGPDLLLLDKEVEDSAKLIISSLVGSEVVEAGDPIKGRYGAAPVRWDAVTRVTDQEREVELLQGLCGNHRGIARLPNGIERIRGLVMMSVGTVDATIGGTVGCSIPEIMRNTIRLSVCSNTLLGGLSSDRRSYSGGLAVGWDEIVGDILDEEPFSLRRVSF